MLASYLLLTPIFLIALISYQLSIVSKTNLPKPQFSSALYKPPDDLVDKYQGVRVEALRRFFSRYNTPLYDHASLIVETADKYGVDWRLVPAIAMQESTLCKKAPANSHNCWGFGMYARKVVRFSSFEEAIETVTKTLGEKYAKNGLVDPHSIMTKYTPSNSNNWAENVSYVMNRIEPSL